jgi:hypothetical protein
MDGRPFLANKIDSGKTSCIVEAATAITEREPEVEKGIGKDPVRQATARNTITKVDSSIGDCKNWN